MLNLRVLPTDLDLNKHVNNGRYATLMDMGRFDVMLRTGLFQLVRKKGWYPVVASVQLSFFRPLNLWQSYQLETELIGWDDRWFIFEQRFMRDDKCCTRGYVKTQIRKGREVVTAEEIFREMQVDIHSPTMDSKIMKILDRNQ